MHLKVLSADKASLFSFPVKDQPEAAAVQFLIDAGWEARGAHEHVENAVASGAYQRTRGANAKTKE